MALLTAKYAAVERGYTIRWQQEVRNQTPLYPQLCTVVPSTSNEESYVGLGAVPGMKEWIGDRNFAKLRAFDYSLKNKPWQQSLGIDRHDIDDDRYMLYGSVISDMARKAVRHPDKLMGEALIAGESTACFDGQYFFDTDHVFGNSGTQSNDLSASAASPTAPTVAEWRASFNAAYTAMLQYKDDQGDFFIDPVASQESGLIALVPPSMHDVAKKACEQVITADGNAGVSNVMLAKPLIIPFQHTSSKVTGGSDAKWYLAYTENVLKGLVFQDREPLRMETKGIDSIEDKLVKFMSEARYNVGYGLWANMVLTTFS